MYPPTLQSNNVTYRYNNFNHIKMHVCNHLKYSIHSYASADSPNYYLFTPLPLPFPPLLLEVVLIARTIGRGSSS